MPAAQIDDVRRLRILEEVKNWAARRYGDQAKALSAANAEIVPDESGDAEYLVRFQMPTLPEAPDMVEIRVTCDEGGQICIATGD